jgi:hypothetical protein
MVLADSGFWLALLNRRDRHHERARAVYGGLKEGVVTTWPVLAEACYLLAARVSVTAAAGLLESLAAKEFVVTEIGAEDYPRLPALLRRYATLPMDLADASLVLLAERLGDGRILTTDQRDFETYRWKQRKPLHNLLFPG